MRNGRSREEDQGEGICNSDTRLAANARPASFPARPLLPGIKPCLPPTIPMLRAKRAPTPNSSPLSIVIRPKAQQTTRQTHFTGKLKRSPIMSILHDLQHIPLELKLALKVRIVENLHRDLFSTPFLNGRAFNLDIILLGPVGEWDFFIQPGTILGNKRPVRDGDGQTEDGDEEQVGLDAGVKRDKPALDEEGDGEYGRDEVVVVERSATFGGQRGVGNAGEVGTGC